MFSWFPIGQDKSPPGQAVTLTGSGYDDMSPDQKPGPGRGGFPGFPAIDVLELFRPLMTVQERVFQKMFFQTKAFSEPENMAWLPTVRTLMVGWRERTHFHAGTPVFNQEDEIAANRQSEIIITELPISQPHNSPGLNSGDSSSPEAAENTKSPESNSGSRKRKREHSGSPPPGDTGEHNCDGNNCAACNNEPCHCINCQGKRQAEAIYSPVQKQASPDFDVEPAICNSENIVSLLARRQSTGLRVTNRELTDLSQYLIRCAAELKPDRYGSYYFLFWDLINSKRVLDVDRMDVLAVLPDGRLIVKSSFYNDRAPSVSTGFLGSRQIKYWRTVEVTLAKKELWASVIVINSSEFIIKNERTYTLFSEQDGVWKTFELGKFTHLMLLNDGRFVTVPLWSAPGHYRGEYLVWSQLNGQPVSAPIGEAYGQAIVLEKSNRIVSFHSGGIFKVWTEKDGVWTPASLSGDSGAREFMRGIIELDDGRLITYGSSAAGVWTLTADNWSYHELPGNVRHVRKLFLLGKNRIISWQLDKHNSTSIKLWYEQNGSWQSDELDHKHPNGIGYGVKGVTPLNSQQLLIWSNQSARVWTCNGNSCSAAELHGYTSALQIMPLSDGRLLSFTAGGAINIWSEDDSGWRNVTLAAGYLESPFLKDVIEIPGGYVVALFRHYSLAFDHSMAVFWDLFPRPKQRAGFEVERLERVERDGYVEYRPGGN